MIIGVHVGALLTLLGLEVAGVVKLILVAVIAVSLFTSLRTHVNMLGKRGVKWFLWPYSGSIRIEDGEGKEHQVEVALDSFVHPWIIVLNLIDESSARHTLLLLPDSVDRQVLRRLRARLLMDSNRV